MLRKLQQAITQVSYAINSNNKEAHAYLPGVKLYPTEIHLVNEIGMHRNMNITAIAQVYGVTRGAISKQVARLQGKGLLEKYQINGNKKEVWVKLTELGWRAFFVHQKFHENQHSRYIEEFVTYTKQQQELIIHFLNLYSESVTEYDYESNIPTEISAELYIANLNNIKEEELKK